MSRIIALADDLVVSLNGASFSVEFTAKRTYRAVFELVDLIELQVSVVPKGIESDILSRNAIQRDVQIDVGIQKKLARAKQANMDILMDVVEEIAKHVEDTRVFSSNTASWFSTENAPVFSQEHLAESGLFTSVLTFTFRTVG